MLSSATKSGLKSLITMIIAPFSLVFEVFLGGGPAFFLRVTLLWPFMLWVVQEVLQQTPVVKIATAYDKVFDGAYEMVTSGKNRVEQLDAYVDNCSTHQGKIKTWACMVGLYDNATAT
jgi:hypothetical protein